MTVPRPIPSISDQDLGILTELREARFERASARLRIAWETQELYHLYRFMTDLNEYVVHPTFMRSMVIFIEQRLGELYAQAIRIQAEDNNERDLWGMWEDQLANRDRQV